jgi:hypothetical protein
VIDFLMSCKGSGSFPRDVGAIVQEYMHTCSAKRSIYAGTSENERNRVKLKNSIAGDRKRLRDCVSRIDSCSGYPPHRVAL